MKTSLRRAGIATLLPLTAVLPAAAARASSSPVPAGQVIAAEGRNGALYAETGSTWTDLGGELHGAPAVAVLAGAGGPASPVYFAAAGSNLRPYLRSTADGWKQIGTDRCSRAPGATVTGTSGAATLVVACAGASGQLEVSTGNVPASGLPTMSAWTSLGGIAASNVAVTTVNGSVTYFVVGTNGHVYHRTSTSGWVQETWRCVGRIAAATDAAGPGTATFACEGTNRQVYVMTSTATGWARPAGVGPALASGPAVATSSAGGSTTLYAEGTDGHVYRLAAGSWTEVGGTVQHGVAAAGLD